MHTASLPTAGWNRRRLKYKWYDGPLQCEGFVEALWGRHYMTSTWLAHLYVRLCWEVRFHILESHPRWVVLSRIYMPHSNSVPSFMSESTTLRPDQQCLLQSINSSGQTDSQPGWEQDTKGSDWFRSKAGVYLLASWFFTIHRNSLRHLFPYLLNWDNNPFLKHYIVVKITK